MNNSQQILVPYDCSGAAMVALETAEIIALQTKARLHLIYVNEHPKKDVPENVLQELNQIVERLRAEHDMDCGFLIRNGKVHREIVKAARDLESTLIVIGAHGRNGFVQEIFAESNAYKVADAAPCPVITIKEHVRPHGMRNIVIPIDSSRNTRQKVPVAATIAELMNAHVHVLVIADNDPVEFRRIRSYGIQTQNYLEDEGIDTTLEVVKGNNSYRLITDYAQKVSADLILVMTEHDSESLFTGPTAHQMINHSPFPVMSVKPRDIQITYASL